MENLLTSYMDEFHNGVTGALDEYDGQYYSFTSPLDEGVFFSIPPQKNVPKYSSPIINKDEGLCVGYMHKGMSTLYDIYDYNGDFVNRFEPPLETPWIDPLDIILIGPVFIKGFRLGLESFELLTKRGAVVRVSSYITKHWVTLLRGRMKWGLSPDALKFSATPARHMAESGRYVPLAILERAIRYGKRLPDVVGNSGKILQRYEIKLIRSRKTVTKVDIEGPAVKNPKMGESILYENKEFTLEVVVDESTWTIVHFLYK
ncbi:TPA: hypothetical protein JGU28_004381 [Salmonella enterica]|nr:hypothetical protein [Salmonella enterica]